MKKDTKLKWYEMGGFIIIIAVIHVMLVRIKDPIIEALVNGIIVSLLIYEFHNKSIDEISG